MRSSPPQKARPARKTGRRCPSALPRRRAHAALAPWLPRLPPRGKCRRCQRRVRSGISPTCTPNVFWRPALLTERQRSLAATPFQAMCHSLARRLAQSGARGPPPPPPPVTRGHRMFLARSLARTRQSLTGVLAAARPPHARDLALGRTRSLRGGCPVAARRLRRLPTGGGDRKQVARHQHRFLARNLRQGSAGRRTRRCRWSTRLR
mmetsp:Transcript_47114/g.103105  ORF Transcript_47114/g.103105 Transcript_47114/m.103105 type:complete len:207 (-) Transcript_47114:392-1012(-)